MQLLSTETKNAVLNSMVSILKSEKTQIIEENQKDLNSFINKEDRAMYDRLIVDPKKVESMIASLEEVILLPDPVNKIKYENTLASGLKIQNKTAPFGTIMIIYESRPDVTIEAAVLAFKANNKILLKGGKEAIHSNEVLVKCWHKALEQNGLDKSWISLLNYNRQETQEFLKNPTEPLDLIVPRGGDKLIAFVKEHAKCAVLVSGRGNNFMYIHEEANWQNTISVLLNAKTQKISACNALDKVLISKELPNFNERLKELTKVLEAENVEIIVDNSLKELVPNATEINDQSVWKEEFLALKIMLAKVENLQQAIALINEHSGGHSACIMTENSSIAEQFMMEVDSAAVYHNASTRFTDGGQMGVGAELAISTDKLHHRGPLGLEQLVSNKYFVFGNGQVRQ